MFDEEEMQTNDVNQDTIYLAREHNWQNANKMVSKENVCPNLQKKKLPIYGSFGSENRGDQIGVEKIGKRSETLVNLDVMVNNGLIWKNLITQKTNPDLQPLMSMAVKQNL